MSFLHQPSRASPWLALASVATALVVLSSVLALFGSRAQEPLLVASPQLLKRTEACQARSAAERRPCRQALLARARLDRAASQVAALD
jgi:hypothetical protein